MKGVAHIFRSFTGIVNSCESVDWDVTPSNISNVDGIIPSGMGHYIIIDSAGRIHITYCQFDESIYYPWDDTWGVNQVWHAWSSDGGHTWEKEIVSDTLDRSVYDNNYHQFQPQMCIDADDTLHFVFSVNGTNIGHRQKLQSEYWLEMAEGDPWAYSAEFFDVKGFAPIGWPSIAVGSDGYELVVCYTGPQCYGDAGIGTDMYAARRFKDEAWVCYYDQGSSPVSLGTIGYPVHTCSDFNPVDGKYQAAVWCEETTLEEEYPTCPSARPLDVNGMRHYATITAADGLVYHNEMEYDVILESIPIDPDGVGFVNVQFTSDDKIMFYYGVLIDGDVCGASRIYNRSEQTISDRSIWYQLSGYSVVRCAVPWSNYPFVGGKFSQLSKQGNCILFVVCTTGDDSTGSLLFTATDDSIIGDTIEISSTMAISQRFRGDFNASNFDVRLISNSGLR
jgi:hypothetical protein